MITQKKNDPLLLAAILLNVIYIMWRMFFTMPTGNNSTLGILSLVAACLLLIIEVTAIINNLIHLTNLSHMAIPDYPIIDDDLFPDVDVFVTTYNESADMLQKTLYACTQMRYPDPSKVHVYLCDAGNRQIMSELATKLNVNYMAPDSPKGGKCGNLNYALNHTSSPLIVTFDADMIPMDSFLMATVPYFLRNEQAIKVGQRAEHEEIGFVQTPHSYYNLDLFQFNLHSENRMPNEQDYYHKDLQVSKNYCNAPIYGGSNTTLSRKALMDIGGFYTKSVTNDLATGMLIQSKKYRCFALPDVQASGISPHDLENLVKQRARWGRDSIRTNRKLCPAFVQGLSFAQKCNYMVYMSGWYSGLQQTVYTLFPILFAIFGLVVVKIELPWLILFALPYLFTSYAVKQFSQNIRTTKWTSIYDLIMSQALLPSILSETLGFAKKDFEPTKKDALNVNDSSYRTKQAIPFALYAILTLVSIVLAIMHTINTDPLVYSVVLLWLLNNMYSLIMALFFILGRVQYRKTERYSAEVDFKLKQYEFEIETKTHDISEEGFSFILDKPMYIDPLITFDVNFNMLVGERSHRCTGVGRVIQVIAMGNKWKYACSLKESAVDQRTEWCYIVHNRKPTLPVAMDPSANLYESLSINISRRINQVQYTSRSTPRLSLRAMFNLPDIGNLVVLNFNYLFLEIDFKDLTVPPTHIDLPVGQELYFRCTLDPEKSIGNFLLYRIDNINEIVQNKFSNNAMVKWVDAHLAAYAKHPEYAAQNIKKMQNNISDFI